jgi:rubrerythrin
MEYGTMTGAEDAVKWLMELPQSETRDRVIQRFIYEADKGVAVPRKFHKGLYGHKYDQYTCGHCGYGLSEPQYKFCPNCGFRCADIGNEYQAKRRAEYEQLVFNFTEGEGWTNQKQF